MKKKIYSLFTIMFLMFTCVFASACGDKYKKMEFKVSYAYSENAEEWFDGTNGISLNYGGKFDNFQIEEDASNIYIKIDIVNVKKKHIDKITVSPQSFAGLQFSSVSVKENEVFALPVSGIVDTTLNLYENNSRKSHGVKLDIYRSLEKIEVDNSIKPALMNTVGNSLNLNRVDNLIYNPYPLEQTNQEGVTYSVSSIGAYDANKKYTISKNTREANNFISIENGILKIKDSSFFGPYSTVVKVKATSIYHDGTVNPEDLIETEFDVYVVPSNTVSPVLKYKSGAEVKTNQISANPHVNLYENGGEKYSTSTLTVDTANLEGPYVGGVNTLNGEIKYSIAVFVKNSRGAYERYLFDDAKYQSGVNGLIVTNNADKKYTFAIANRNISTNNVKFAYVLDGLDFSASSKPDFSTTINVAKSVVPTVVTVNNTLDLKDGDTETATIYGTQSSNYKGLELKFTANPNDDPARIIEVYKEDGLILTDGKNQINTTELTTGSTIFVKFAKNVDTNQTLVVRTLKSPSYYDGAVVQNTEYITITYVIEKRVTADELEFVKVEETDTGASYEPSQDVVLDAKKDSAVFVKVYYTGSNLDRTTIKLESDNEKITFTNNSQSITLDNDAVGVVLNGKDVKGNYSIFKVPVNKIDGAVKGNINVIAGDGSFGVRDDVNVTSVYLMNQKPEDAFLIETTNETVKKFKDVNNFVISKNQFAEFHVYELAKENNVELKQNNTIVDIRFEDVDVPKANNFAVSTTKISNSVFTVFGSRTGTKVFNVVVSYYCYDNNGNIIKSEYAIPIQIAVVDAIGNINVKNYNNLIAYINNYFTETTSTSVEFESYNSIYGNPASDVKFFNKIDEENYEEITEKGASQIKISIDGYETIKNSGSFEIKYTLDDYEINLLDSKETEIFKDNNGSKDYYLNGKISVKLLNYVDPDNIGQIKITIRAYKYDIATSVMSNVVINIAEVDKATGISVSGKNLIKTSDENVELRMSFMDKKQGDTVEDGFNASIRFENQTQNANVLRFNNIETALTYMVYKYNTADKVWERYFDDFFTVTYVDGKVNIKAYKDNGGGYFKFVLATKDSYNSSKDPFKNEINEEDFDITYSINVRVSDGSVGAEYVITDVETFKLINYNLSSHFVLGANIVLTEDIDPIGLVDKTLTPFTGSLGQLYTDISSYKYSITYNVNKTVDSTKYGTLAGLFAIIGEGATVKDVILNVTYATDFTNANESGLKVGALAGVNNGTIENVTVNLVNNSTVEFDNVTAGNVDFGGVVGLNNATVTKSKVDYEKGLIVSSTSSATHNIGLVAGTNEGSIIGEYLGKESLNNIIFDVIVNLQVKGPVKYNVGAVAGLNTNENKTNETTNHDNQITNIIVGGQITAVDDTTTPAQSGNVAGVVGASSSGKIETVTAISLNVSADTTGVNVAGIVGSATSTNISHAKFVSAITTFKTLDDIPGQINGVNIAGIAGNITGGSITASSVESFVDILKDEIENTTTTFPTLNGTTVYGIAKVVSGTTVSNCFVNANVNKAINDLSTISYFVGKVGNDLKTVYGSTDKSIENIATYLVSDDVDAKTDLKDIYIKESETNYVKAEKYVEGKTYVKFNHASWLTFAKGFVTGTWAEDSEIGGLKNGDWRLEENHNFIYVNGVKFYFPYLVEDVDTTDATKYEAIMIVAPQSIKANVNATYQTIIDSTYVNKFNIEDYNVKEMAVVNYFAGQGDENNAHNIIKDKNANNGLLDAEILPNDAQGGLEYQILGDGYRFAYINRNKQIVFTGASGQTPILVRIYSLFNPDINEYVVFYSLPGVTELQLSSTSIVEIKDSNAGYAYETSLYTGQNNKFITLTAQNKLNNNYCSTILDNYAVQQYLVVESETVCYDKNGVEYTDSKLTVNTSSYKNMTIKINEDETVNVGDYAIITFKLYLDTSYFTGLELADDMLVKEVKLLVKLYNSATSLEIIGADKEITTFDDINFHVYLTTDYRSEDTDATTSYATEVNAEGKIVLKNDNNNDSIEIALNITECEAQKRDLINQVNDAKKADEKTIEHFAELFKVQVTRYLYKDNNKKPIGYIYNVTLELIDDHNYRFITDNIKFNVIANSTSNLDCNNANSPLQIVLKPTVLSTARIENYAVNDLKINTTYTDILSSEDVETSIVEPGSLGNVMMIYLQPTYSNVVSAKLITSSLYVPSLGKDVQMKFTQLVYNQQKRAFTTLYSSKPSEQVGDTLELQLISELNENGKEIYTGVILVHVQLEKFAGLEGTISATLEVETSNGKIVTRTRNLLTTYLPGTSISYNQARKVDDNSYLIQKGTYDNEVKIKIYGYQFNSNPVITFNWELPYLKDENGNPVIDGEGNIIYGYYDETGTSTTTDGKNYKLWSYKYVDNNKQKLTDDTNTYLIGNYVSYYLINNYTDIAYNEADDSYTLTLKLNVAEDIPASFTVNAELYLATKDGQLKTTNDSITFNPTEYIINSIYVDNLANGKKNIAINKTNSLDIKFTTDNVNNDLTQTIYQKLLEYVKDDEGNVNLGKLFSFHKNGANYTLADKQAEFEVNIVNNEILSITGISKFSALLNLNVNYGYRHTGNGVYELFFGRNGDDAITVPQNFSFTLEIYVSDEYNEFPIYSADEIYNSSTGKWDLVEGGYYVLMNDIELENVVPITTKIGSFDGNNRTISIKNFATNVANGEYGLFANLGEYTSIDATTGLETTKQTILKNVIVDYSKFDGTLAINNDTATNLTFGGLVAKNNGGIIYNCDVMNLDPTQDKQLDVIVANNADITLGGLVGANDGVITNSRVGRESYTRIIATKTAQSETKVYAGGLTFRVYNKATEGKDTNQFSIVAGGFVGENSGLIASSYIANTNLTNFSTNEVTNKTAGFVGENSGTINYSYSKADDSTINSTNPYSTDYVIENKGNGIVAGFVYTNSGEISNSYANIELKTTSAYISGFVYDNTGTISESYAASTMNSGSADSRAEQPFIGVNNANVLMNTGSIENSYYLMRSNIDTPYYYEDRDVAQGLNLTNFQNSEYLIGFVFVLTNSKQERDEGIWSYYTLDNQYRMLPELMNTNNIAHSYRYVVDNTATTKVYTNAVSYAEGSKNNPYIIASVKDYNKVFTENNTTKQTGYIRFINNIDFNNDETAIKTRTNYVLGDSGNVASMTSVEGNGMTISGIYLDVGQAVVEKIGLFAAIENAYIKNLNLEFATPTTNGQFSTTTVQYSGGLAGTINNGVIINVKLNGTNTTLTGSNFVGGLAGLITGNSLIYGIETNLNVKSSSTSSSLYYNELDYNTLNRRLSTYMDYETYVKTLSYAGGVAGVLDLTSRSNVDYNVQFVDVRGDLMKAKNFDGKQEANILAEYAGGVAGYANEETSSFKVRYITGNSEIIRGNTAVGGLYGVAMGEIVASQVAAEEDTQYKYDTKIGEYVLALKDDLTNKTSKASLDTANIGNISLLEGYKYVGGLVGLGLNTSIQASYAKASIKSGAEIGGLIGSSITTSVRYSYAIPFINSSALTDKTNTTKVGGLFGSAYGVDLVSPERNNAIKEYENLLKYKGVINAKESTDIMFTYSTLLVDKTVKTGAELDYVVADYYADGKSYVESDNGQAFVYVCAGPVDYPSSADFKITNNTNKTNMASIVNLSKLFDVTNPEQTISFQEVFSGWSSISYWSLKEEKYFPLLNNEAVDNFIDIDEETDFSQLAANPEGKFRVVDDITIPEKEANWIVGGTFKGLLIGQIPGEDRSPNIKILGLKPNLEDSTGFFKQTIGATISNLNFIWVSGNVQTSNPSITLSKKVKMVSGLTCDDEGSLISNVEVVVSGGDGYIVNDESNTITGFGGIVGNSTNTNVLGCTFVGKIKATLSQDSEGKAYVGGIVAKGETEITQNKGQNNGQQNNGQSNNNQTQAVQRTAVINSSRVGVKNSTVDDSKIIYPTTSFDIAVGANTVAYIGGVIGYANNVAIASTSIGGTEFENAYKSINLSTTLNTVSENIYIGGLTGFASDGIMLNCDALTVINSTATTESGTAQIIYMGGLAGEYQASSTNSYIQNCSVKSDIKTDRNFKLDTSDELMISTGVAMLSGNATMDQCLFIGNVNTEDSQIGILYAGGAVANAGVTKKGNPTIEEVTTNAELIVGNSSTTQIYVGGLIGYVNKATISYSSSLDRVVPVTSADASEIYGGGLIGRVENSVAINNSYTISTIIADSIAGTALKNLNMGALIGDIPDGLTDKEINVTNTYYSSDYALFADENYLKDETSLGINLSAENMINGKIWHSDKNGNGLMVEGTANSIWKNFKEKRLPYLTSLETELINYGVLSYTSSGYDYVEGSSMRPIPILSGTEYTFPDVEIEENKDVYNYYLLIKGTGTNIKFVNPLSGVLIGQALGFNETFKTDSGNLLEITKHSAVSNLHVNITDKNIKFVNSLSGVSGVIATENNGVIFNSSVQGTGVTISGSNVGLIAGRNNGLIAYSYSGAEIVSTTASLAGIVHTNAGKLLSNYFTGYIESTETSKDLAGIVVTFETSTKNRNDYAYNNYMAGVIKGGKGGKGINNFSANLIGSLIGENNFIDSYSDIGLQDVKTDDGKTTILDVVNTAELMTKREGGLTGEWYFFKTDGEMAKGATFGCNYNYPAYKFNRRVEVEGDLIVDDTQNLLYTGKGVTDTNTTNTDTAENRYKNISNHYNDAFKIPHLGVLSSIQSLTGVDRNYVLIYDIDGAYGDNEHAVWNAVGTTTTDSTVNGFKGTGFQGMFITNRYYALNNGENKICTITNLSKNGLFANINKAHFADINLGSFYNLANSGALGTNINKLSEATATTAEGVTDTTNYNVTVDNVTFLNGSTVSGAGSDNNYYGGLFGDVQGNLRIDKFTSYNETNKTASVTLLGNEKDTVGLIAGKSNGIITLSSGKASTYYALFNGNNYAGGVVGEMYGGKIDVGGNIIYLVGNKDLDLIQTLGGVVGKTTGECCINNATVNAYADGQPVFEAQSFGGIVGEISEVGDDTTINNCGLKASSDRIDINTEKAEKSYHGLVAGLQTGTLTINGFVVEKTSTDSKFIFNVTCNGESSYNDNLKTTGVGTFVGKQTKNITVTSCTITNINITVTGIPNLGGISGCYSGGNVLISDSATLSNIVINGTTNVGGVFGWAKAEVNSSTFDGTTSSDGTATTAVGGNKILITGLNFATINIGQNKDNMKNFGGLFGKYSADKLTSATNSNAIEILNDGTAYNVGGVAGLFTGTDASNLNNGANIEYKASDATVNDKQILSGKDGKNMCNTVNVGGIFGLVKTSTATIKDIFNNADTITGYQNVGGLIGYVTGSDTSSTISNPSAINSTGIEWDTTNKTIIDKIDSNKDILDENKAIKGKIYGVLNVGGAVGFAGTNVQISQIYSNASVYGNSSVGGLVGFVNKATLTNNYIQAIVDTKNTEDTNDDVVVAGYVKGIYYNYNYKEDDKEQTASYIPTSVGGFVGSAITADIKNNIIDGVKITSTNEGIDGDVISTIDNYMVNFSIGTANTDTIVEKYASSTKRVELNQDASKKVVFNEMSTGYGGFVGSTNAGFGSKNVINAIDINAQLGVNVGTYYGVYYRTDSSQESTFECPDIYGEILVDGAYNIGGLTGYLLNNANNMKNDGLNGKGTINLQSRVSGIHVGGLIGKAEIKQSTQNLNISTNENVKIKLYTNGSYFLGGLIGQAYVNTNGVTIEGSVGSWNLNNNNTPENTQDDSYTLTTGTDKIIAEDNDDKFNFGGLIGMLKVGYNGSGYNITIKGLHNYPFTINTVENSNYHDGTSSYNASKNDGNIELYSQAYYINLDKLNIQASQQIPTDNPLDNTAVGWGWAADYTMMRTVQRCIPKAQNSNKWDSIASIYDAINIKGVVVEDGKITSTVYEEEQGSPNVYTKEGVYFPLLDKDGMITGDSDVNLNERVQNALKAKGYIYDDTEVIIKIGDESYTINNLLKSYLYCGKGYVFLKEIHYTSPAISGSIFEVTGTGNSLWGDTVTIKDDVTKTGSYLEADTPTKGEKVWSWVKTILGFIDYSDVDNFWDGFGRSLSWPYNLAKNIQTLVETYQLEQLDRNELAEKFYIANQSQSYGVLSNMYSREIKYSKDALGNWYVNYENDDFIEYQGFEYNTYTKIRPSDYFEHRYLLLELSADNSGTISLTGTETKYKWIDKERPTPVPITEEMTTLGKSNLGWDIVKKGETTYLCIDYYLYYLDQYWINTMSVAQSTPSISNNFFEVPTDSEDEELSNYTYLQNGNGNYVYGNYNPAENKYSFKKSDDNYVKENDKYTATVNYGVGSAIDISSNVTAKQNVTFALANTGEGIPGYDWMQNAIYSVNGVTGIDSDIDPRNGVQELVKYGKFEYVGDENSSDANARIANLKENYQYVIKPYYYIKETKINENGEPYDVIDNDKNGVFVLVGTDTQANIDNLGDSSKPATLVPSTSTISLAMYPATFDKTQFTGTIVADEKTYQAGISDNGVRHEVEYFLYIGGFKVRDDDTTDNKLNVYIETDETVVMNGLYYDKNGNNSYDEGDIKNSEIYMEGGYKISEYYIPTSTAAGVGVEEDMIGKLCKDYLTFTKNPEETDARYGKYCSDLNYNLYTRYKYNGLTTYNDQGNPVFEDDSGKYYNIIPINGKTGSPNIEHTVFVEVVKVCFGSKQFDDYNKVYTGANITAGNGTITSGWFSCSVN